MQRLFQQALSAIGFGGSPGPDCRKEVPEAAALKGCVAAGGMALGLGSLSPGGARTAVDDFSTHPPSPCGDEAEGSDLEVQVGEAVEEVEVVRTLRVYSSRSPQEDLRQSLASADSDAVAASAEREKEEAASSRDVQIMRVFRNPDVLVAPSLVADSLCSHLLNVASNRWEPSKTSVGLSSADQVTFLSAGGEMDALQGGDCVAAAASLRQALVRVSVCAQSAYKSGKSPSRTSKSAMLKDGETPGVSSVELLACSLARMPLQHLEPLVVVRYDPGEYFNEHHDGAFRPVTVLLYLNGERQREKVWEKGVQDVCRL